VLNARTDIYLMPIGPEATRFERTVERLRAYREAGADCLFAPGVYDLETIQKLVQALKLRSIFWRIPPAQASRKWKKPAWPV